MRSIGPKLAVLALVAACTGEPTSTDMDPSSGVAAHTGHIFMGGPKAISTSGSYTYTAYAGLLYPQFHQWGFRACNTSSITGCTSTWLLLSGTQIDEYRQKLVRSLTVDCSFNGKKTYQVRAVAQGFGHFPDTGYYVTSRCGPQN
jgi:hypothetical protein